MSGFSCLTMLAPVSALMWLGPGGFVHGPNKQQGERTPLHLSGGPGGVTRLSPFLSHNSQGKGLEDPTPALFPPVWVVFLIRNSTVQSHFSKPGSWSVTEGGTRRKVHSFSRWCSCGVGPLFPSPLPLCRGLSLLRTAEQQSTGIAEHFSPPPTLKTEARRLSKELGHRDGATSVPSPSAHP